MQSIDSGSLSFLSNILSQQLTKAYHIITGQMEPEGVTLTAEYASHSLPDSSGMQAAQHSDPMEPDDDFMLPGVAPQDHQGMSVHGCISTAC